MVDYCTSKRDIVGAKRDLLGMFQMVFTPAFVVALLGMEMQVNIACKALVRSADAANLAESARALTFFEALSLRNGHQNFQGGLRTLYSSLRSSATTMSSRGILNLNSPNRDF